MGRGSLVAVLWHRPAAVSLILPLAWELPCAVGVAIKKKKKKRIELFKIASVFDLRVDVIKISQLVERILGSKCSDPHSLIRSVAERFLPSALFFS